MTSFCEIHAKHADWAASYPTQSRPRNLVFLEPFQPFACGQSASIQLAYSKEQYFACWTRPFSGSLSAKPLWFCILRGSGQEFLDAPCSSAYIRGAIIEVRRNGSISQPSTFPGPRDRRAFRSLGFRALARSASGGGSCAPR